MLNMENSEQKSAFTIPMAIVAAALIIGGSIFFGWRGSQATRIADTKEQKAAVAASSISIREVRADDHIKGNPSAPFVLVEYSDIECPACKVFHSTMQKLMNEYGKNGTLAWVYRHFPLDSIHPKARNEAIATECAAELGGNAGFWDYLDKIFEITPSNNGLDPAKLTETAALLKFDAKKFTECAAGTKYAEKVQNDYEDGISAGATGTPYNILVLKSKISAEQEKTLTPIIAQFQGNVSISTDKTKIVINGALPYEAIKRILDALMK